MKLPDAEYNFILREVNRRKMTLKGWMAETIRNLREQKEEGDKPKKK